MTNIQEAVEHRLDEVDVAAARFLETFADQLGRPGSPAERDARYCGYPSALAMFIAQQSADLGFDLETMLESDIKKRLEVIK